MGSWQTKTQPRRSFVAFDAFRMPSGQRVSINRSSTCLHAFRRQHVCTANTEIFCAQLANFVSAPPSFGHRNRTRATRTDTAVPLEISGQYGLRPPPSDGTDSMGDVEFPQRCPPPDQERTPVRSGQRSLAGVASPRHLAAGKAQVRQRSVRCTVLQHSAHFTVMHAWCNAFAGLAIHVYFTFRHAPSFALYSLYGKTGTTVVRACVARS